MAISVLDISIRYIALQIGNVLPALGGCSTIAAMQQPGARVDYSLARKATLRAFDGGRVSRYDICDAHPDLIRAANYCGEPTTEECPVCERGPVVLVSYVFCDELPKIENGKIWDRTNLTPLPQYKEARVYTVEVCRDCSWNHVRSQVVVGHGGSTRRAPKRGRRAST
jgi:uncharacterized protein DUF5318